MVECKRCRGTGQEPDLKRIGRLVRKARLEKGWTLREAARRARCSPAYACDLENGRRAWQGAIAHRYCKVAGVLYNRTNDPDWSPDE